MKKILLSIFFVFILATNSYAFNPLLVCSGQGADTASCGGSCNTSNDEIGRRDDIVAVGSISAEWVVASLYTADCSGALETAYLDHNNTDSATAKVCIYTDDGDDTPDSGDTLVGCSASMSSSSDEMVSADVADCYTVTSGNSYWLIIAVDDDSANAWSTDYQATGTGFYDNNELSTFYDSPPANLGGATWTGSNREWDAYVTIK